MAWFSNGRKYWKHQGRIYSCRVKHHFKKKSNDNKYNFKYASERKRYNNDLKTNEFAWMDALDSMTNNSNNSNNFKNDFEIDKRLEKANDDYLDSMYNAIEYDEIEF